MVKINNQVQPGVVGKPAGKATSKKAEGKGESAALEGDRVDIAGGDSAAIAKSASRNVSDVDEAKVAELRSALARGEYRADMRVVAERVINEALVFGKG